MINFNDYKFERPDFEDTKSKINSLIELFKSTTDKSECLKYFKKIIDIQNTIEELSDYADIRNMRDGSDEFYSAEMDYWNEIKPQYDLLFKPFYLAILSHPCLSSLREVAPENFFNTIEYQLKITNEDTSDLLKRESELKSEYRSIIRERFNYNGEEINLAGFAKYFNSNDASVRENAHNAYNDFFYSHQLELDNIISELVSVRNKIANICGFNDYSEYSIYKLRRFGYNYEDIKKFRDGVIEYFLPINERIREIQKKNLGVDELHYYDTIFFKDSIELKYHGEELVKEFIKVFYSIDEELGKFFESALNNNYIDLLARKDKVGFAITNYLSKMGLPTVTANYKDTIYDVNVTLHETGHAYQKLNAANKDKNYLVSALLKYPTFDVCEMFSYAMQLIGLDYVDSLFDTDNYQKYVFSFYKDMLTSFPYMVLVDEFQESIYKDNLSGEDIRKKWLELSHKYGQDINNSGHINLDSGSYFYRQSHIFTDPFYYIDYAISYFGAIAIYSKCQDNLEVFNEAASVASYYPLKTIMDKYSIPNPFDLGQVKSMSEMLVKKLDL